MSKIRIVALLFPAVSAFWLAASGPDQSPATPHLYKSQGYLPFADTPINYRSSALDDPIARLNAKLAAGTLKLEWDVRHGYLPAVLHALQIPISSQTLVFSKTSFQYPLITPVTPRALYFNDDVYVGEVQNANFLEFASFDPRQGAIFYVLDAKQNDQPRFERAATDCVQCHVTDATKSIPGVLLRSVFTRPSGYPAGGARSFVTGQESPWSERWGGWYVTAHRSGGADMSNAFVTAADKPEQLTKRDDAHLRAAAYLTNSSDVVALTVLAHQTQMHNLITLTNYKTRLSAEPDGFKQAAEQLVRYLLFANEAPLGGEIEGDSSFTKDFAQRGPFDAKGRSLRQFDLQKRLFRYPCSYLIYSETFDAIPEPAKSYVFKRLLEVLSGRDQGATFQSLTAEDRRAVLEILLDTKRGFADRWKQFVSSN